MQERISRSQGASSDLCTTPGGFNQTSIADSSDRSQSQTATQTRKTSRIWTIVQASACCWFVVASCWYLSTNCAGQQVADPNNILLDFSATWCGPCQQMSPIVSKLERMGYPIRKVDVDAEPELTRQFHVDSMPTFVLVSNGREMTRIVGKTSETELRRLMSLLPKQNIDNALVGDTRGKPQSIPQTNPAPKAPAEKKPFLKMPQLFPEKEEKAAAADMPGTFRGQSPNIDLTQDGFVRDPMAASVRIRVKDGSRVHFGSGTVIESQVGKAVILTCGHIFRDLQKDAVVEVDLVGENAGKPQILTGKILNYDLDADVGLLSVPSRRRLPVCKLGVNQVTPAVSDRVASVGCGGGEKPTREDHAITAINRYRGPDTIECNGLPQLGRSGGGLFLGSDLIGVCIFAEPKQKRGIYAGPKPIAELLAKSQLGHLLPSLVSTEGAMAEATPALGEPTLGGVAAFANEPPPGTDDELAGIIEAATKSGGKTLNGAGDYAGAEIVCIVRPKTPGAASRVVIVNQATSRFVDDLLHESSGGRRDEATVRTVPEKKLLPKPTRAGSEVASTRTPAKKAAPPASLVDNDEPIETSFEPQRYRRQRD